MATNEINSDHDLLLRQLTIEFLKEKRRSRFWKNIWRIVLILFFIWLIYAWYDAKREESNSHTKDHIGLIDIKGDIFANENADAENFSKAINKAYKNSGLKALIFRIDSPGGSPVQADYMFNTIRYYQTKYPKVKTYAVCVDTCASAAYYVASAAHEIYANPSSIVGSIGVLYNGFGFVDTMQKLGVTRRLQTAGKNKGFLDQFSPVQPGQEQILQTMLDLIHQEFIKKVKLGRGKRLKVDDNTFSGLFWTGTQAKAMGLIDGFASSGQLAREIIKIDEVIDYSYKENVFEKVAKHMGAAFAHELPLAMGLKPGFN